MPSDLKVSHPQIANMVLFVNISNYFQEKYYLNYDIQHIILDTWDDSFMF